MLFSYLERCMEYFSHKYGTFSQQISAPSSSFSEVAFSRPPSVKWSPKSNRFQRRTLRATLHGASTADQNEPTLKSFEERSNDFRRCLHDTGATFVPERVHSGSLSWLYIVYMIPPQNVMPARVTPALVHPGSRTRARISLR